MDDLSLLAILRGFSDLALPLAEITSDEEMLRDAKLNMEDNFGYIQKALALCAIAEALITFGDKTGAKVILRQAVQVTENNSKRYARSTGVMAIGEVAAKMGDFKLVREVASKQVNKADEAKLLALSLEVWAKGKAQK
ncbi:MAG: hypothetical protein AB7P14_13730 [Blastocatellales bacterium]